MWVTLEQSRGFFCFAFLLLLHPTHFNRACVSCQESSTNWVSNKDITLATFLTGSICKRKMVLFQNASTEIPMWANVQTWKYLLEAYQISDQRLWNVDMTHVQHYPTLSTNNLIKIQNYQGLHHQTKLLPMNWATLFSVWLLQTRAFLENCLQMCPCPS